MAKEIKKDYSKAWEMYNSEDWDTFYTGLLMLSELSLEDPDMHTSDVIEVKTFSRTQLDEDYLTNLFNN